MTTYMQKPEVPPTVVWVVNPDGRVIDVKDDLPMAGFAASNRGGWSLATEAQITEAKAEREERNAEVLGRDAKRNAAKEVAHDMAAAAESLVEGEAAASPKRRTKKGGKSKSA